jgi:uncharacterized protein YabE (DUF348 family)
MLPRISLKTINPLCDDTYYTLSMVDKLEEEKRTNLQRNEGGNEDPTAAMSSKEVKQQGLEGREEEDDYYEEGNGGATD